MRGNQVKVYSPNKIYQQGFLNIYKEMFKNLVACRELIWQLFLRDFKTRYKQSLLGWAWIFLMPIITMGTFLLLNISGVIKIGKIPVPYPIFGLLGFSLWQIFSHGWSLLTTSITAAGSLVSKINFPKEALVIASFGQVIVDFLIRLTLVLIVYLLYGLTPSIWLLLFPFYILPIFFLTLGLGFLTSLLNVISRDSKNFVDMGTNFFLFLMPVMYTMPEKGLLVTFNKYNPIYFIINTPRDIIILGTIKNPLEFLLSSIISLVFFLIGWAIFYISQSKLAEIV